MLHWLQRKELQTGTKAPRTTTTTRHLAEESDESASTQLLQKLGPGVEWAGESLEYQLKAGEPGATQALDVVQEHGLLDEGHGRPEPDERPPIRINVCKQI